MNDKWYRHIIGARTIKTGLATFYVFILYVVKPHSNFAILTAIVTIEPTAKASLKRGIKATSNSYRCVICCCLYICLR